MAPKIEQTSLIPAPIERPIRRSENRFYALEKVYAVALPVIVAIAGAYFGFEYHLTRHFIHLVLSTTMTIGGLQSIFENLSQFENPEKARYYHSIALSLGVVSILASALFFCSSLITFQALKIAASLTHFFLACEVMRPQKTHKKAKEIPFHPHSFSLGVGPKGLLPVIELPEKKTYIPSSPKGFCNIDRASCFFSSTIKLLLSSPYFQERLEMDLDESYSTIPIELREHMRQRLIILRDELKKDLPDPKIVSNAWYELRYENAFILGKFPEYNQDCAYEIYNVFQEAIESVKGIKNSLIESTATKVGINAETVSPSQNPFTILRPDQILEEFELVEFELSSALKTKYKEKFLDKKPEETDDQLAKRQALRYKLTREKVDLDWLLKNGYIHLSAPAQSIEEQIKDCIGLEATETVTRTEKRINKPKQSITVQEQIDKYLSVESIDDFLDDNRHPIAATKRHFFSHPNLKDFSEINYLLPIFRKDSPIKENISIKGILDEITIPVFDQSTNTTKVVRLRPKAIICHIGETRSSGHYKTYIKEKDKWIVHNDGSVSEIETALLPDEFRPKKPNHDPFMISYEVVKELAEPAL
jgi:hypothetical protein